MDDGLGRLRPSLSKRGVILCWTAWVATGVISPSVDPPVRRRQKRSALETAPAADQSEWPHIYTQLDVLIPLRDVFRNEWTGGGHSDWSPSRSLRWL